MPIKPENRHHYRTPEWKAARAAVVFQARGRRVRFMLTLPDPEEYRMTGTDWKAKRRDDAQTSKAWEQACRSSWRALLLVIKAKLEAVEAGITCFDDEFMAHIVLPSGDTVGDFMRPQIATAYSTGTLPKLLPMKEPDNG